MGEFIPKEYKNEQVTVRINKDVVREIDEIAALFNLSRNKFINQCIDYAMTQLMKGQMERSEGVKE